MIAFLAFTLVVSPALGQDEPGGPITEGAKETPAIPVTHSSTITATSTSTDRTLEPDWSQPPPAPPCPRRTEEIYQQGFTALVDDDAEKARERFDEVIRICPSHRVAPEMKRLAESIAGGYEDGETKVEGGVGEEPNLLAWGELVAFQTLHGVGQGILICAALGCEEARPFALAGFAGASVGAGLSIIGFKRVRYGQASAINSGTGWGIWNAIALSVITEPEDRAGPALASGMLLGGTLAGIGVAWLLSPRNGSVSFSNSMGIWLGVMTLFIGIAADAELDKTIVPAALAVTNLGLIGGAILSYYLDISRGRVLLIDAGGVVGLLLGLGLAALINTDLPGTLVGTFSAVGTAAGLVSTFFITRGLDEDDDEDEAAAFWVGPFGKGAAVGATF